ncbi:MAG TPA: hypothetical protein VFH27_05380, partial [Longimicrobiaceae bacterium]|nr:hypothetical protein [Longimicrobiaceae bacterium]
MKPLPEATLLNPYAGSYLITPDLREQAASVRAGDRSVAEFPYYVERYGERGRLFGRSDSAWIARLATCSEAELDEQVDWLSTVLASRGMPRWLMVRHLRTLYEELCASAPERTEKYAALLQAADRLAAKLAGAIPEAVAERLALEFEARADAEWRMRLPHMGRILVAAVADEHLGLDNAVPTVLAWAADAERFPTAWVQAVHGTIAAARAAVLR